MLDLHWKRNAWSAYLLFLSIPFGPGLRAQAVSGSITGTVSDATGAVVPGASVTLADSARGITTKVVTSESGSYTLAPLLPGSYEITVEKSGLKTLIRKNVIVGVARSTRLDVTLHAGDLAGHVTVTADPPGLSADRSEVETTPTGPQID